MNSKNSLVIFIVAIVCLAMVVAGFAIGSKQTEPGLKIAWIGGSLLAAALGVFLSVKLKK